MMKIRKFLIVALAAVTFAACNKDVSDDGTIYKGTEGEAWLAVKISTPEVVKSKNLHDPDQENGSEEETHISNVRLIFFDGFSDASKVTSNILLTGGQVAIGGNTGGTAFKVSAKSKSVLVIVNEPVLMDETKFPVDMSYAQVNAAVDGDLSKLADLTKTTGFMMTNSKGGLEPSVSNTDGTDKALVLYTTAAAAEGSFLSLNVDRVVAKVRVYNDAPMSPAGATIKDFGWVLNITTKQYFPVSKRVKTAFEALSDANMVAPFDQYKFGSYRIDPTYDNSNLDPVANAADYNNAYNYYASSSNMVPSTWKASGNDEYCLENTQDENGNYDAWTTQALVKYKYFPKKMKKVDGTEFDPVDVDWIKIGANGYYTLESFYGFLALEIYNKYASAKPDDYQSSADLIGTWNAYLTAIGDTPVNIPSAVVGPTIDSVQVWQDFVGKLANIKAQKKSTSVVSYYIDGVNYYDIMIKHDDQPTLTNALGEFGVVRNSVYDVRISAVNNPGSPTIEDPNKGKPDESDNAYLSVKININPWTWYTQTVEL